MDGQGYVSVAIAQGKTEEKLMEEARNWTTVKNVVLKTSLNLFNLLILLVGVRGFEPPASTSRT